MSGISKDTEVHIVANAEDLARAAASEFVGLATEAVRGNGFFTVVLSGGSTPGALYSLLADDASLKAQLPWDRTHVFWGDERHVPPDHADSNYRMVNDALLARVAVPAGNVHRIKGELEDARQAADEYERVLRDSCRLAGSQLPRFDLVLLGMGLDGHTASLFPRSEALHERQRLVVANRVGGVHGDRITMTVPVLNNAACVLFLVGAAEKAETLRAVLESEPGSEPYPAQLIQPARGRLLWLVTGEAGRLLGKS